MGRTGRANLTERMQDPQYCRECNVVTLPSLGEPEGEIAAMGSIADQCSPANNLLLAPKLRTLNCLVPFYFVSGINLAQSFEIKGGDRGREGYWSAIKKPAFTPAGEGVLSVFQSLWTELKQHFTLLPDH